MFSLLENKEIFFKLYTDVRVNELTNSWRLKASQCHYETFLNESKGNNTETAFKTVVSLEITLALLKEKAYETPECLVEAPVTFEI